jgi:hypothetical protein
LKAHPCSLVWDNFAGEGKEVNKIGSEKVERLRGYKMRRLTGEKLKRFGDGEV